MKLGAIIAAYLRENGSTVRQGAAEIGLSSATLHRLCAGENVDSRTLAIVVKWLFSDVKPLRHGLGPADGIRAHKKSSTGVSK